MKHVYQKSKMRSSAFDIQFGIKIVAGEKADQEKC